MNPFSRHRYTVSFRALAWAALAAPLLITACASGGSGGASPPVQTLPPPPPPPAPPPPPPPPPPAVSPSAFETPEYNATRGLPLIKASSAYAAGATGQGIIVGVVDTGADQTHPDLTGQFTGPTFDVRAADRAAGDIDEDGHGTLVSGIVAARRDGSGIMGVAFGAKVLDVRADRPGSCAEDEGCKLQVSDIIAGINHAIDNGATIINLSLGSSPTANTSFEQAILDAAARGVLIVIAAGNDAEPPGVDENGMPIPAKGTSPNSPARAAGFAGAMGRVIAVGSVIARDDPDTPENEIGKISAFSNRAGPDAKFRYILAPGEGVVTTGPDGTGNGVGDFFRVAGTSFAAPYIAGSLALLLQHFPNLQATPETAIQILLDTADDYVDPNPDLILGIPAGVGPDDVSGVGIVNLANAFAPQGPLGVIVNREFVPLGALTGPAGGAFGDWAKHNGLYRGAAMIDRYDRAFTFEPINLDRAAAAPVASLSQRAAAMAGPRHAVTTGTVDFAWSAPRPERNPAAPYEDEPAAIFSTTIRFQGGEVSAGRGGAMPRLAPDTALAYEPGSAHALSLSGSWGALSHEAGPVSLHAFAASDSDHARFGAGFGRAGPHEAFRISLEHISHDRTALGGGVQSRLGGDDSSRLTALSLEGYREMRAGWRLSGGFEAGFADIGPLGSGMIPTTRWSAGLSRPAGPGALTLVIAQPRRAEGGSLSMETVTGASREGLVHETLQVGLSPSGRQLNVEARYSLPLRAGWSAEGAAALLRQPGHVRGADEAGALWFGLRGNW